ncbi:MAG: DUF58 domain-containing protein [Gammaproteobacteria bacterium]|nr:DUF58 domain-containing protein [Gammaproteobacteria bacterium]
MALNGFMRLERAADNGMVEVGARRIYILPTRYGLIFAVLVFLMLLGAVNYGNNPAHLLTFLLAAIGSNAIYLTWRNLRGLHLRCLGGAPVFAGQTADWVIEVRGDARERPALQFTLGDGEPLIMDLAAGQVDRSTLPLIANQRGLLAPGRLMVSTQYPVGLFRAWCYVDCSRPLLVYPRPGPAWDCAGSEGAMAEGESDGSGTEDFAGLRRYVAGDQPSRIDWKSYARDRGLNTRLFSGQALAPLWLEWDQAPGNDTEEKLSSLCRAVIDAEAGGREYGLRTPQGKVEPGSGPSHRHRCLRLLALYGKAHA